MNDLYYEFYIGGTPEQVWETLVSEEATKAIYWGSVIESTFEIGSPIRYVGPGVDGDQTVHVYGTILAYEPARALSFTHFAGESYHPGHKRYESRISYQLEACGKNTKLTMIHDQWHPEDPAYANSGTAWWMVLSSTKTLVETGKALELSF